MSKVKQSSLVSFLIAAGNRKEAIIASFAEDLLVYTSSNNSTFVLQVLRHVSANMRKPENRAIWRGLEAIGCIESNSIRLNYAGYSGAHTGKKWITLTESEKIIFMQSHENAVKLFTAAFNAAMEKKKVDKPKTDKPKTSAFTIDSVINAITSKTLSDEDIAKIKLAIASIEPIKPVRKKTAVAA